MTQNKSPEKKSTIINIIGFILIFLIIIGTGGFLFYKSNNSNAAESTESEASKTRVPVVLTNPVMRTFERTIITQGNIDAKIYSLVSPRIPGTIEAFFVDEGNNVIAGETKLFHTDSVKLQQNVTIRENDLAVAICAEKQAKANLEKVQADFDKTELDYKRFERLLEQDATTQDTFEKHQSSYKQLAASLKVAQTQVDLVSEQVRQAQAALVIARKDLDDTTVISPITGVISMRLAEPGETGSPGNPVLRIEYPNLLEASAFISAEYYPSVIADKTVIQVKVSGIDLGSKIISYKSPSINPKLRTFEVKCLIENPPDGVAPGAMADVTIVLESHNGLGIPVASVQKRANKSVVFEIEGDTARMQTIETGLENNGWVEITGGNITESNQIVSMGQDMLNEGTPVTIQKEAD